MGTGAGAVSGDLEPRPADPAPPITLFSDGLLSKWGFNDGDAPEAWLDYCDENGIDLPPASWHPILRELVKRYLLPVLDQDVTIAYIGTSHNPVRARMVDGTQVEQYWRDHEGAVRLTPECVEIPMAEVARVAAELYGAQP